VVFVGKISDILMDDKICYHLLNEEHGNQNRLGFRGATALPMTMIAPASDPLEMGWSRFEG